MTPGNSTNCWKIQIRGVFMKATILQSVNGKTYEELALQRANAISFLQDQGYEVERWEHEIPPPYISQKDLLPRIMVLLNNMNRCAALYCCSGWREDGACQFVSLVARSIGDIKFIFENDKDEETKMPTEEALLKQIPKEPLAFGVGQNFESIYTWKCPRCLKMYSIENAHNYCPRCGQKIYRRWK